MYLTKDVYFEKRGIDLDIEFKSGQYDDPSNAVDKFLQQIEDFVVEYLETNYGTSRNQLDSETMEQALIYQVDHVLETGEINKQTLSDNAYRILRNKGYCNMQTDGSKPVYRGMF